MPLRSCSVARPGANRALAYRSQIRPRVTSTAGTDAALLDLRTRLRDKFKLATIGGWVFDNARYLRKMEVYFADMALYPEEVDRMHRLVGAVYESKIHLAGQAGADGIMIGEGHFHRIVHRHVGILHAFQKEGIGRGEPEQQGVDHQRGHFPHGVKRIVHQCFQLEVDLRQRDEPCRFSDVFYQTIHKLFKLTNFYTGRMKIFNIT